MKKREVSCSYFEDAATLEAKRQRQSAERQKRYLVREKQKAIALMRQRRRVRLALEGFVDVFKVLPRSDLNTLEISCSTFHSVVSIHVNGVCLVAVDFIRVEHQSGHIVIDQEAKFRAIDEGHTDAAPMALALGFWQKRFRENVYVLLQRVVSKCFVEQLLINDLRHLDDVAFKALIAIQPNVDRVMFSGTCGYNSIADNATTDVVCSALFRFPSVTFTTFRAPYEVFTGHAIKRPKDCMMRKLKLDAPIDQDRYHDEDLNSLFSIEPRNTPISIHLQGLRLSSEFILRIIEAHTSNVLSTNLDVYIHDSKVDEQKRGTHSFVVFECAFGRTSELVLELQNLPRLNVRVNLDTDSITIVRYSY
ncbi:hypothetical protein AAVH_28139 [Aphelenchoides avenae]|nr:hypothetical protein AAVH_28139 [Aphelenchus avenae]